MSLFYYPIIPIGGYTQETKTKLDDIANILDRLSIYFKGEKNVADLQNSLEKLKTWFNNYRRLAATTSDQISDENVRNGLQKISIFATYFENYIKKTEREMNTVLSNMEKKINPRNESLRGEYTKRLQQYTELVSSLKKLLYNLLDCRDYNTKWYLRLSDKYRINIENSLGKIDKICDSLITVNLK